ncbi:methylamine utilization protein MauD [Nocardiopsis quinghaiensis]|uniref:methylamine utilization protein MauD n=1 Tax=Nocardiopsis quinghaiensis TaxID=464995 RepID=UPI001CC25D98|nr:methylamine utilization protein MauD [Nocardiopsis quinghaiensis]
MLPEIAEAAREVQSPLLAVLLLLGALARTTRRAGGTGLTVLAPGRLRRPSTVATGLLEAALAVGLLAVGGLLGEAVRILAACVFAVSAVALLPVRGRAPEAGCGCFGGLGRIPAGWRAPARAGLLSAAALAALGLESAGWQVVASAGPTHAGVLGAELLVLALLGPEPRGTATRRFHREPCDLRGVSPRHTMRVLRRSEVWRTNVSVMTGSEPGDVWRQGCWRLLRYDGTRHGRRVDVVYAVRAGGRRDTAVRAVLIDRASGAVVASFGAVARTTLPSPPRKLPRPRQAARRDAGRYDAARAARTLRAARAHPAGSSPEARDPDGRDPDGREPTPA